MKSRIHGVLVGRRCLVRAARLLRDWSPGHVARAGLLRCPIQQGPGKTRGSNGDQELSFLQCPFSVLF